jgi:chromosome partitioning protein
VQPTKRIRLDLAPSAQQRAPKSSWWRCPIGKAAEACATDILSNYDYILIDCPPSLGLLTVNALTAAQGVLIPVQCEYLALEGLSQLMNTIQLVRKGLNPGLVVRGLVMTMYDGRMRLAQQVVTEVQSHFGEQVFSTLVPRSVRLGEAPSYGEPILTYAPTSAGGMAYAQLADELLEGDRLTSQRLNTAVQKAS